MDMSMVVFLRMSIEVIIDTYNTDLLMVMRIDMCMEVFLRMSIEVTMLTR